jgi:Holliday junction resolvase-like predicted endonuclease
MWMDRLGIAHSQKVLCFVEVKVSSEHENLHTNPTRNQAQNHMYETPGFYPQHNQVPQCSYNTMLQVTRRPTMQ